MVANILKKEGGQLDDIHPDRQQVDSGSRITRPKSRVGWRSRWRSMSGLDAPHRLAQVSRRQILPHHHQNPVRPVQRPRNQSTTIRIGPRRADDISRRANLRMQATVDAQRGGSPERWPTSAAPDAER